MPPPGDGPPGDGRDSLAAVRARAAEAGVSVSEYVREALWRARGEEAWERALAQAREEAPEDTRG